MFVCQLREARNCCREFGIGGAVIRSRGFASTHFVSGRVMVTNSMKLLNAHRTKFDASTQFVAS